MRAEVYCPSRCRRLTTTDRAGLTHLMQQSTKARAARRNRDTERSSSSSGGRPGDATAAAAAGRDDDQRESPSSSLSTTTTTMNMTTAAGGPPPPKRVKVTELAAAELAAIVRKTPLSAEEERRLQTRLQYRMYQRNHRARQQRRIEELEGHLAKLREEIRRHEADKAAALAVVAERCLTGVGRVFQPSTSEAELASTCLCADDTVRAEILTWRRGLAMHCASWSVVIGDRQHLLPSRHDHGDVRTVMHVVTAVCVTLTWDSLEDLARAFPRLRGHRHHNHEHHNHHSKLLRRLQTRGLRILGRGFFDITRDGQLARISLDLDVVGALVLVSQQHELPLPVVSNILQQSFLSSELFSPTTSRIDDGFATNPGPSVGRSSELEEEERKQETLQLHRRISMEFLLNED